MNPTKLDILLRGEMEILRVIDMFGEKEHPDSLRWLLHRYVEFVESTPWKQKTVTARGLVIETEIERPLTLSGFLLFSGFSSLEWEELNANEKCKSVVELIEAFVGTWTHEGEQVGYFKGKSRSEGLKSAKNELSESKLDVEQIIGMRISW